MFKQTQMQRSKQNYKNPFDGKVASKDDSNSFNNPFRGVVKSVANLKGEAAILKKSFEEYMRGNISLNELEKIDDALSKADIGVNKSGTGATIVDSDGNSTNLGTNAKKGRPR